MKVVDGDSRGAEPTGERSCKSVYRSPHAMQKYGERHPHIDTVPVQALWLVALLPRR